jgi:hypothetical protein
MIRLKWGCLGAVVLGGAGFILGFFGPLILTPGANQGPLLGIFITGPIGFLGGLGLGVAFALPLERRFTARRAAK